MEGVIWGLSIDKFFSFCSSMIDHLPSSTPVIRLNTKAAANLKLDSYFQVSIGNFEQTLSKKKFEKQTCACEVNWKGKLCDQQSESKLQSIDTWFF